MLSKTEGNGFFFIIQHILFPVVLHWTCGKGPLRYRERKYAAATYMGRSFQLTAWDLLYASSCRQDSTYHSLCYCICGAMAGIGVRSSSVVECTLLEQWVV